MSCHELHWIQLYSTVQYSTVQYSTVQYSAVQTPYSSTCLQFQSGARNRQLKRGWPPLSIRWWNLSTVLTVTLTAVLYCTVDPSSVWLFSTSLRQAGLQYSTVQYLPDKLPVSMWSRSDANMLPVCCVQRPSTYNSNMLMHNTWLSCRHWH